MLYINDYTPEEEEQLRDEYEYYDEWLLSDAREEGISLFDYDEHRRIQDYGLDMDDLDEDAFDEANI